MRHLVHLSLGQLMGLCMGHLRHLCMKHLRHLCMGHLLHLCMGHLRHLCMGHLRHLCMGLLTRLCMRHLLHLSPCGLIRLRPRLGGPIASIGSNGRTLGKFRGPLRLYFRATRCLWVRHGATGLRYLLLGYTGGSIGGASW